jgi:hypothetical protein
MRIHPADHFSDPAHSEQVNVALYTGIVRDSDIFADSRLKPRDILALGLRVERCRVGVPVYERMSFCDAILWRLEAVLRPFHFSERH